MQIPVSVLLSQWTPEHLQALFAHSPQHAAAAARVLALEGIAQAQLCYGRMLLEGTGTHEDKKEAFAWFVRAAAQGDFDALNMMGRCHENGWGTPVDFAEAASYYHRAAGAGHAWAQYNLGHLYLDGNGVQRDPCQAYRYYLSAAEQRHERAMNLVGRCCEEGWGTPRDPVAAAVWYRRSAEAGYFRGQYNWASILLRCGREDEARVWLERAAQGGTASVRHAVMKLSEAGSVYRPETFGSHRRMNRFDKSSSQGRS
ncbi:MAG TPA: tetratricopeptide repeat protein [Steroidobacteraceae bacterium]|nr:tetratricopeptide repeat protein [Steroidobacteraceae bacterium]